MVFLMEGTVEYEFRTTVIRQLHTAEDIAAIGKWFRTLCPDRQVNNYFIQPFVESDNVLADGLCAPDSAQLQAFLHTFTQTAESGVRHTEIRGFTP